MKLAAPALFVLSTIAAPALAQTAPAARPESSSPVVARDVMARVEQALRAIDSSVPRAFWQRLGPEGLAALALILDDGTRPVGLRRRAVTALGQYQGDATARALLTALARATGEDEIVSRYAVVALAEAFGVAALDDVLAALRDARPLVREGAVLALGRLRRAAAPSQDDRIRTALASARAREPEPFVVVALDAALVTPR